MQDNFDPNARGEFPALKISHPLNTALSEHTKCLMRRNRALQIFAETDDEHRAAGTTADPDFEWWRWDMLVALL